MGKTIAVKEKKSVPRLLYFQALLYVKFMTMRSFRNAKIMVPEILEEVDGTAEEQINLQSGQTCSLPRQY